MKRSLAPSVVVCLAVASSCVSGERAWEVRGELETVKSGTPQLAVLRLIDGRRIEVPLDALSQVSQEAVRAEAVTMSGSGSGGDISVRGASGRIARVDVPQAIKDVEADAVQCRSATQAADVYRLFLASDRLTPEQRSAAEARAQVWQEMSERGLVRLGDRWVPPAEAVAATGEARKVVAHALELMRLGNADLAEDELRKASRLDPDGARASFVTGLAYARVANKPEKAVEHFASAVDRDPRNAASLNDLAVLEVLTRRHAAVARHFRQAIENAVEPMPIAENIAWAVKLSGAAKVDPAWAKYRMPDKTIDDLNTLYRLVTQELKLKTGDNVGEPRYLGPDGGPCTAATLAEIAALFEGAADQDAETRIALGFALAPGRVMCPRQAITRADGSVLPELFVETPQDRGNRLSATVVAAPEGGDVALLQCDGLVVKPLSLAAAMPPDSKIFAIDRSGESWLDPRLAAVRGTIVTPAGQPEARERFVHTAVVPRGLGGGPIIDGSGQVVGMVAPTPRTDASGNAAGFGIPVEQMRAIMAKHASDAVAPGDAAGGGSAEGERLAVAGTVVVVATTPKPQAAVAEPTAPP
jgi:Flp pilus assembly protein TadD